MQEKDQQSQSDLKVMDQLSQSEKEYINSAQESFKDVQASLRTTLPSGGEKERLELESTQKRKSEGPLTQSQPLQTPLSVSSSSSLRQEM